MKLPKKQRDKRLLIIDHVGVNAGMDYFSSNMGLALAEKGVDLVLCSNFSGPESLRTKIFFRAHLKSKGAKAVNFFVGHFLSWIYAVFSGTKNILFHSFETGLKEFIVLLLFWISGKKLFVILHDVEGFTGDSKLFRTIIFRCFAYRICVLNKFSKELLVSRLGEELDAKTISIKHGHFLNQLNRDLSKEKARELLSWNLNDRYVLFFGQIKKVKGLDILLQAFNPIKSAKLVLAGKVWRDDFSLYQPLVDKIEPERIDLRIRFIPDSERELLFRAADIVVLPYRKIYQSGVLIMAMGYEKTIIASDLPANREVIVDKYNGLLFETESVSALRDQLEFAIEHQTKCREMGSNAFETVQKDYAWGESVVKLFNELIM